MKHPAVWCHKIWNMNFENGSLLVPLSVALAGFDRADIRLGDPALVCGAGSIGLITLPCLRAAGACPLVITDIDAGSLKFAKELVPRVITYQVSIGKPVEEYAAGIIEAFDGIRPRVAMECLSVESLVESAIWSVKFGGKGFVSGSGRTRRMSLS